MRPSTARRLAEVGARGGCAICTLEREPATAVGPEGVFAAGFAAGVRAGARGIGADFCPKHQGLVDGQLALVGLKAEKVRAFTAVGRSGPDILSDDEIDEATDTKRE